MPVDRKIEDRSLRRDRREVAGEASHSNCDGLNAVLFAPSEQGLFRRLVWRVLRNWTEIAHGGRFPRCEEIDAWMRGEDGANCVLIAVEWSIELSHFVVVGVNLAVALCSTDTLAGTLPWSLPQVVSSRRGLMIDGVAALRGEGIRYRAVPTLGKRRYNRSCPGRAARH
jgi:hypothetical protein